MQLQMFKSQSMNIKPDSMFDTAIDDVLFKAIDRSGRSVNSVTKMIESRGCWAGTSIATSIALMRINDKKWLLDKLNSNECYTPKPWIEFARRVFGLSIDLDVSSNVLANQVVRAARFFTWEDDALKQEWHASTVWCNPPFSTGLIAKFVSKLIEQRPNYGQAIVLVNASMNSRWCQTLQQNTDRMLVPSARINFWKESTPEYERATPNGSNAYDQVLFYIGENTDRFEYYGSDLGVVFKCVK